MSQRQWELLSAITFGLFGTGQCFADRPSYGLNGKILTVEFTDADAFKTYTRRAFTVTASRLVAFKVHEVKKTSVICHALFNQTKPVPLEGSMIAMVFGLKQ